MANVLVHCFENLELLTRKAKHLVPINVELHAKRAKRLNVRRLKGINFGTTCFLGPISSQNEVVKKDDHLRDLKLASHNDRSE